MVVLGEDNDIMHIFQQEKTSKLKIKKVLP